MMSQVEVDRFLEDSGSPLKLGTIDRYGDPVIHPLWYLYEHGRIYLITDTNSRKAKNLNPNAKVYFCVDTETRPYKGVKGKGTVVQVSDPEKAARLGERIISKYMGGADNPLGRSLLGRLREGKETLFEITPRYLSVWDDGKSP
jgi:nitroimidazol reductase NimA-like FMN-containing flavoprotein (pyridoxamine 5'-phosphate oxidase superfamily)